MTLTPIQPMPAAIQAYMQEKLQQTAREHGVRILLAVESGSRAWGFPSADSDYDVRFIYARTAADYVSVKEHRDVIETPIVQDDFLGVAFDLNGWDIRKALQLALKSNPVLLEWLASPLCYMADACLPELRDFARQTANLSAIRYHYDRLARAAWQEIQEGGNAVKVKRYCYALRPALAVQWVIRRGSLPPMDVPSLCSGMNDTALLSAITELIVLKARAQEADTISRMPVVDAFVSRALEEKAEQFAIVPDVSAYAQADTLFQHIVGVKNQ